MTNDNITERIGIHRVALTFLEKYGWLEREQFVSDFGIDTQVEIVKDGIPTGLLYCLQVKSGKSYIKETDKNIVFYTQNERHINYWINHSLPVLLVICDIKNEINYWDFITSQNISKTEKGWNISISKSNNLADSKSKEQIENYYFSNDNFTVMESGIDTSHALSRRISMKIILKNKISNIVIEEQLPQLIEGLKKSDYFRSKIVEDHHKDNPADCVWIWFYKNIEQYSDGLPFCTAYWNHPNSKSPTTLHSNDKEIKDGIFINYSTTEISNDFLNKRLSKGNYLKIIDNFLLESDHIFHEINKHIKNYESKPDILILKAEILKYEKDFELLLPEEYRQNLAPLECSDLDQIINNIEAAIGNIFIVTGDIKRTEKNIVDCIRMFKRTYLENIEPVKYERKKII